MSGRLLFRLALAITAAMVATAVSACDSDDADNRGNRAAQEPTTTATPPGPELARYCEAAVRLETAPQPDVDFGTLSPEQQKDLLRQYFNQTIQPLMAPVVANAPAPLKADTGTVAGASEKVAATGDFDAFEAPKVKAAERRIHGFELEHCRWARQDVEGTEYAFQGVSTRAAPGAASFEFANTGTEMHELQIVKKRAGVTESFDRILELDEAQAETKVDMVAGVQPIRPGDRDYAVVNLERGEYLIVCFLSEGATPAAFEALESGGELPDGPPHFTLGMKNTITVA